MIIIISSDIPKSHSFMYLIGWTDFNISVGLRICWTHLLQTLPVKKTYPGCNTKPYPVVRFHYLSSGAYGVTSSLTLLIGLFCLEVVVLCTISYIVRGSSCGLMAKILDNDIVVSKLESDYYLYFRSNSKRKGVNPFIPLDMD